MLAFHNIHVQRGGKTVLENISFSLTPHTITGIIGKNGSGKSTLISCLTGSVPYTGEILYRDKNIALIPPRERAQLIAVLPQILPKSGLTVQELVTMGRLPYLDIAGHLTQADIQQIQNAMVITNMAEYAQRRVDQLSGGERQKSFLAMILAQNTRVVALDEPSTYMDMVNEAELISLLTLLKTRYKKTVVIVMHDLTKAVEISDNILVLDKGNTQFFGDAGECAHSTVIEDVFGVKKGISNKNGVSGTLYYL